MRQINNNIFYSQHQHIQYYQYILSQRDRSNKNFHKIVILLYIIILYAG